MTDNTFSILQWQEAGIGYFDRKEEYVEKVQPLVDELHKLCKELGIQMVARFFYAQDSKGTSAHGVQSLSENLAEIPPQAMMMACLESPTLDGIDMLKAISHATGEKVRKHLDAIAEAESASKH